jgi:hypothetical protein
MSDSRAELDVRGLESDGDDDGTEIKDATAICFSKGAAACQASA